jgi:hypothetical protein
MEITYNIYVVNYADKSIIQTSSQKLLVYFDRSTRDTPKLMLEMPKPSPAPLVKSSWLMADRAVPVMTPAKCRPRNSLSML